MAMQQLGVDRMTKQVEKVRADLAGLTADLNVYLMLLEEQKTVRDTLTKIGKELEDIRAYQSRADQAGVLLGAAP